MSDVRVGLAFLSTVERPTARLLREPRGERPVPLLTGLCRELGADRPTPHVLFDNLPHVGDAQRFLVLLGG